MIARLRTRDVVRALAALAIVLLAACARHRDVTVITFWTIGREGEVVRELLDDFERAHPGVRVESQQMPLTAAHEKLLTAFAGDSLPDIGQLGNTWIPELATLGALAREKKIGAEVLKKAIGDLAINSEKPNPATS